MGPVRSLAELVHVPRPAWPVVRSLVDNARVEAWCFQRSAHLPDLADVNELHDPVGRAPPPVLVVAFDALGGEFAIDGGGLGIAAGEICYRGPDTLQWDGLGVGHGAFVGAALEGELAELHATLRWPGWQEEVSRLRADEGLSVYPPPFSVEGRDIGAASRRAVPFSELREFYAAAARRLDGLDPGTRFEMRLEE